MPEVGRGEIKATEVSALQVEPAQVHVAPVGGAHVDLVEGDGEASYFSQFNFYTKAAGTMVGGGAHVGTG